MKCKLKNVIGYIENSHERLYYNSEEKRFWDESSSKGTQCLLGFSCSFSTQPTFSNLGFRQNPSWGRKLAHTNLPQGATHTQTSLKDPFLLSPGNIQCVGGVLDVWEMCYSNGGISICEMRGMVICCPVSPNSRMCPISDGINGAAIAIITSLALQTHPWHFSKGKSNLPLSWNIRRKREEGIHQK